MAGSRKGSCRPIEILLVEDNPGDVRLTREALKEGKVVNNLQPWEMGRRPCRICAGKVLTPRRRGRI